MGFWGGELFANDHAADVRDELVLGLEEAIDGNVEEIAAHLGELSHEAQALLVTLDTGILAPAAMLAALIDDPVVRATGPDAEEVERWRAMVTNAYAAIRQAEQHADTRAPSHLINALPGQAASGEFWRVRETATDDLFNRLARADAEEHGDD